MGYFVFYDIRDSDTTTTVCRSSPILLLQRLLSPSFSRSPSHLAAQISSNCKSTKRRLTCPSIFIVCVCTSTTKKTWVLLFNFSYRVSTPSQIVLTRLTDTHSWHLPSLCAPPLHTFHLRIHTTTTKSKSFSLLNGAEYTMLSLVFFVQATTLQDVVSPMSFSAVPVGGNGGNNIMEVQYSSRWQSVVQKDNVHLAIETLQGIFTLLELSKWLYFTSRGTMKLK